MGVGEKGRGIGGEYMGELDFSYPNDWMEQGLIILAPTGSHAYGTNVATSDLDYRGVCIPPVEYYLGMDTFKEYNNNKNKQEKNTSEDVDVSIASINHFVRGALSGLPNNIELLFIDKSKYSQLTKEGERLVGNRHLFLSQEVIRKFCGYGKSQRIRMERRREQELAEGNKLGYETKTAMHVVRTLTSAIEILLTGDFNTYRPNREELVAIRKGKYTYDEMMVEIKRYEEELKLAEGKTTLPLKPDYHKVNEILIGINRIYLRESLNS